MFKRGKWRNVVLVEGEKEAKMVARIEGYPDVNPDFERYPVDLKLRERRGFWSAMKKAIEYSKHGIYNIFYKTTKREREEENEEGYMCG